jgi:hypothetical protein
MPAPRYDPSTRARLRSLLEAGEALRAAAEAYGEALTDAPVASAGLSVGLHEDEGDGARVLIHAEFLADVIERLTGVVDDATRKVLAEAERAALATYAAPASKKRGAK